MERGAIATLKVPYLGYRRIELIEPYGNQITHIGHRCRVFTIGTEDSFCVCLTADTLLAYF